ncbi:MAG: molecular chaperone HtpG [Ruminococcaceae bacterium]|nr:molecular chaperone HtpG [Oscillospiraceae bacterium]
MAEEKIQKGGISVQTEHIFPVIKRWLYSDKEIFLREIVSNACDAITKMKRLVSLSQAEAADDYKIRVAVDKKLGTLTVTDNGIGMSGEEVSKYICQIALSGALEFVEKYQGEGDGGIIGHFGLGFYSAFMVSDTVELFTKSYTDAEGVHWSCNESGEYTMEACELNERGTKVVMHVTEAEKSFLEKSTVEGLIKKYCAFMPVEIFVEDAEETPEEGKAPEAVNDTQPLWQKNPSECTEEDYKSFYHKLFPDMNDPLFYIHINADFPLNFKGILYFPKLSHEYANLEGQVKLYYNQVFVADNIKEVIPEYLMLLKGVLDCPELPLNVSRSYLQNSGYVAKLSAHIVKKVCDKLNGLFNNQREMLEGFWADVKPFVEYGCMRDRKFFDRTKNMMLLKCTDDKCRTVEEYLGELSSEEKKVYYTNDVIRQASYVELFRQQQIPVAVLDAVIDTQFVTFMENENKELKFVRIDGDVDSVLKGEGDAEDREKLTELFKSVVGEGTQVEMTRLKNEKTPAIITFNEEQRRFDDMMKFYTARNGGPDMPSQAGEKLCLNLSCPLMDKLEKMNETKPDNAKKLARQIYMLAVMAQRQLTADETGELISQTLELMESID